MRYDLPDTCQDISRNVNADFLSAVHKHRPDNTCTISAKYQGWFKNRASLDISQRWRRLRLDVAIHERELLHGKRSGRKHILR
ncbi:MAG: hypothetical protein WCH01_20315 [Methylococcaceae bacterium]